MRHHPPGLASCDRNVGNRLQSRCGSYPEDIRGWLLLAAVEVSRPSCRLTVVRGADIRVLVPTRSRQVEFARCPPPPIFHPRQQRHRYICVARRSFALSRALRNRHAVHVTGHYSNDLLVIEVARTVLRSSSRKSAAIAFSNCSDLAADLGSGSPATGLSRSIWCRTTRDRTVHHRMNELVSGRAPFARVHCQADGVMCFGGVIVLDLHFRGFQKCAPRSQNCQLLAPQSARTPQYRPVFRG